MKKATCMGILLLCGAIQIAKAQYDSTNHFVQYAGVQMNPLIRQVFNFNNSNQTIVNPYLFTYSFNWSKSGNGIRFGGGANFIQTTTNDGVTKNETNEIDYELRLGYDKILRIAKRWEVEAGFDLIVNDANNFTNTTTSGPFTTSTKVSDVNLNYGGGPMASIRFYATRKILIGTETSIYYTRGFPTETITDVQKIPGQPDRYTTTTTSSFNSQATLSLPVAFYLILKF